MSELADRAGAPGSAAALRHVMGAFLSGVTVVTADWDGRPHAMTATAFSSVSLEPPLVLVCVSRTSRFHAAILGAGRWAVSVLASDQEPLARHFSNRGRDLATQFDGVPHRIAAHSGAPVLEGAHTWLDCETYEVHDGGDHSIVLGLIRWADAGGPYGRPLTYYEGDYGVVG